MSEPRTIRIAGLQLRAQPGAVTANLELATPWVERAARQGARLVVLPELYASGYYLTREIWDAAEPPGGPTVTWLKQTARRLGIYLGTGYLLAEGEHFLNVFALAGPDGEIAGQVAKHHAETYFFKEVRQGSHVIETPLGRIGIGICADNHFLFLPRLMQEASIDLMLMPHASPAPTRPDQVVKPEDITQAHQRARGMAPLYAGLIGVPALFVNQVGPMGAGAGPRPGILFKLFDPANYRLSGLSTIADSDSQVKAELGTDEEGIVLADVTLDPARKVKLQPTSYGGWLHPGSALLRRVILPVDEMLGRLSYRLSRVRQRKALSTAGQAR